VAGKEIPVKTVKIPKGNGAFRTIYVPSSAEKSRLRSALGQIARKAERACPEGVCHGFRRMRSPVTNALAHVGHAYTLCFDLTDFFDSVTADRLKGSLTEEELSLVLVDGAARQGLPTSPAVANLAAAPLDHAILKFLESRKLQVIYTRYADDLSFSYDDPAAADVLLSAVPRIVGRCGFRVNRRKTRLQAASAGRRVVTGVAVDDHGVHPTRAVRRRLRAARHQGKQLQARGLEEWCKLKPPSTRVQQREQTGNELDRLVRAWRLPRLRADRLPDKGPDEDLGGGCVVTGDPVYMLGMSNWTTGWRTCMTHPGGKYRKSVYFWVFLRGTRLAALLSDNTTIFAGVERRRMRARALVHTLRNGVRVYDRIYGNPGDVEVLKERLQAAGYVFAADARKKHRGEKVVGHCPARWRPWLDTLHSSTGQASTGPWKGQSVRTAHL
jgi:hypothetical protein